MYEEKMSRLDVYAKLVAAGAFLNAVEKCCEVLKDNPKIKENSFIL